MIVSCTFLKGFEQLLIAVKSWETLDTIFGQWMKIFRAPFKFQLLLLAVRTFPESSQQLPSRYTPLKLYNTECTLHTSQYTQHNLPNTKHNPQYTVSTIEYTLNTNMLWRVHEPEAGINIYLPGVWVHVTLRCRLRQQSSQDRHPIHMFLIKLPTKKSLLCDANAWHGLNPLP